MSQHDFNIADALTPAFRTDLNLALVALAENSGGGTEPSTTFAGQTWLDTSGADTIWKIRAAADDAWITVGVLDETNDLFIPDFNGLSFSDLDLIHHDGTDFAKLAKGTGDQILKMNAAANAIVWSDLMSDGFLSSGQTITAAGALTLAHSLGAQPVLVIGFIKCTSAEINYSEGDEVYLTETAFGGTNRGVSVVPDATNLVIRFGSGSNSFEVLDKTTGATASITNTSWDLYMRAWL